MRTIYHYTSFETFQKIVETGTIRLNSLQNVDDAEEGFLLDSQSQAAYTFVSCWTKQEKESIPLWKMYVKSQFSIRIGVSSDFLKPIIFKRYFISNHTNRNAYIFLFIRGDSLEFLSDVIYEEQPKIRMLKNMRGMFSHDYVERYGLTKSTHWSFQEEIRFIVKAVPISQIKRRYGSSLYIACHESIINNAPTDIKFIDMNYDKKYLLSADIMLGPSTTNNDKHALAMYLKEKIPEFNGTISRSGVFIRS